LEVAEMIDKKVLNICSATINQNLGRLDDLPYELANTVANIYYKFFLFLMKLSEDAEGNPGWIPRQMKQSSDWVSGFENFIDEYAIVKSDIESIKESIVALREIDRDAEPNLYSYTVEFLLDCYKYNIPQAYEKSPIRRKIERKFKKPDEIPNLIELI